MSLLKHPGAAAATMSHPAASTPVAAWSQLSGKYQRLGRDGAKVWVNVCPGDESWNLGLLYRLITDHSLTVTLSVDL